MVVNVVTNVRIIIEHNVHILYNNNLITFELDFVFHVTLTKTRYLGNKETIKIYLFYIREVQKILFHFYLQKQRRRN